MIRQHPGHPIPESQQRTRRTNKTYTLDNKIISYMPEPVVNNKQASCKIARYLNQQLNNLINLQYTYAKKNSYEIAQELNNILINKHSRMITLDIKELYVNFSKLKKALPWDHPFEVPWQIFTFNVLKRCT